MRERMHNIKPYCIPPQEDLWPVKLTWNMSGMLVWSTRWEQPNSWAPPTILMLECANQYRLATLHLEVSHTSNHMYAKNSLKTRECPNVILSVDVVHNDHFYTNIEKNHFYQNKHHWSSLLKVRGKLNNLHMVKD